MIHVKFCECAYLFDFSIQLYAAAKKQLIELKRRKELERITEREELAEHMASNLAALQVNSAEHEAAIIAKAQEEQERKILQVSIAFTAIFLTVAFLPRQFMIDRSSHCYLQQSHLQAEAAKQQKHDAAVKSVLEHQEIVRGTMQQQRQKAHHDAQAEKLRLIEADMKWTMSLQDKAARQRGAAKGALATNVHQIEQHAAAVQKEREKLEREAAVCDWEFCAHILAFSVVVNNHLRLILMFLSFWCV